MKNLHIVLLLAIAMIAQTGFGQTVLIGGNQYAFRWTGDPDIGLYFSSANSRYEFRDLVGSQEVWINPNTRTTYFRGKVGVNNTNPTGRLDARAATTADVAGVIGRGLNSPTNGYLGVQGDATNFDGVSGLDIYGGYEIGVMGLSTGGSSADNFGVLGYSNDVGVRGENSVSGYAASIGSSTHGLEVTGPSQLQTPSFNSAVAPGPIQMGSSAGNGLSFDNNEIQTYSGGSAAGTFYLQYYGGNLDLVNSFSNPDGNINMHGLLYVDGPDDFVGIGTSAPANMLDVNGRNELGDLVTANAGYVGSSDIRAFNGFSKPNATGGYGYGGQFTGGYRGVYGVGSGSAYTGTVMGVYGNASGTAGSRYGVYGSAFGGTTNYAVYASGNMAYTGTITDVSDARFKENVKDIEGAAELINKLQPRTYDLKVQEYDFMGFDTPKEYGFVAQELEEVLPLLVHEGVHPGPVDADGRQDNPIEFKSVNYVGMIPVIVAAMQEQQEEIDSKDEAIEELKDQVAELAAMVKRMDKDLSACCTSSTSDVVSSSAAERASLGQNVPNPFNGATTINYYLPKDATFASIKIVDINGSIVKEFNLQGEGLGQVSFASEALAAGNYFYSMLIDGEVVDTKQMNIVK